MNASQLLKHFDRLAEAPDAVARLRRFILDLAVRGKLVEQDAGDEPAAVLFKRVHSHARKSLPPKKSNPQVNMLDSEIAPAFDIPQTWKWTRLLELGRTQTGATPSKNAGEVYGNHIPFVKPGDLLPTHVDYSGEGLSELGLKDSGRSTSAGSLLMVCIGTIGKCQLVDRASSFNQQINSLEPYEGIESRYLLAVLMSEFFQKSAWMASAKTTIPILNKGKWEQLPIPLPPLAEQHRIVAKVDELMALCDQLEAAQQERERRRDRLAAASLQRLNQPAADATPEEQREYARFHLNYLPRLITRTEHIKAMRQKIIDLAICGRVLSRNANDQPASALLAKKIILPSGYVRRRKLLKEASVEAPSSVFPDIPSTWAYSDIQSLYDLNAIIDYADGNHGAQYPRSEEFGGEGVTFVTARDLVDGRVAWGSSSRLNRQRAEQLVKGWAQGGDVLLTHNATVGRVARVETGVERFLLGTSVTFYRLNSSVLSTDFFYYFLKSSIWQGQLEAIMAQTTRNQVSIQKQAFFRVVVPPLAEQLRIAAKVDELMALCDQLEGQLTITQTDSRRLLEAVLEHAL